MRFLAFLQPESLTKWVYPNIITQFGDTTVHLHVIIIGLPIIILFLFLLGLLIDVPFFKGKLLVKPFRKFMSFFAKAFGGNIQELENMLDNVSKTPPIVPEGWDYNKEEEKKPRYVFAFWMKTVFVKEYANNVQALAYWGAAILIVLIGLRGIKAFTAEYPSPVIFGLLLEFIVLCMLGLTMFYTPETEPEDKHGIEEIVQQTLAQIRQKDVEAIKSNITDLQTNLKEAQEKLKALEKIAQTY